MKQTFLHRPHLTITADFSKETPPVFRYSLEAIKINSSKRPKTVCAIMQNPSYAQKEFAYKSVQVLERVVFEKGFKEFQEIERLIVVNQFAFIQTKDFEGTNEQIGKKNNLAILNAIKKADIVLIAWEKDNPFVEHQKYIIKILKSMKGKKLLKTSRHPSRVIYNNFIQQFDA